MLSNPKDRRETVQVAGIDDRIDQLEAADVRLHRWQVSFRSGEEWFAVGEFVALDAAGAMEQAVELFGPAQEHRAEEIPWDAVPLFRAGPRSGK